MEADEAPSTCSCFPECFGHWYVTALPQDCQERVLRLPARMVPLRLRHDWRPVPRAILLSVLHCHYIRCASFPVRQCLFLTPAGPRFALVGLWYLLTRRRGTRLPALVAGMGVFRTLTCGGWTFITSTDDHDWHDILMISYLVATLPWTTGCIALSPPNPRAVRYRKYLATGFFSTLVPMIYYFIQHKVHRVAGGKSSIIQCAGGLREPR